jgi:hypothetical protein
MQQNLVLACGRYYFRLSLFLEECTFELLQWNSNAQIALIHRDKKSKNNGNIAKRAFVN